MSLPPDHEPKPGRAAVPADPPRRRPAWLIPLIAGLAILLLLLLLLTQCGGDDDDTGGGTDGTGAGAALPTASAAVSAAPSAPTSPSAGTEPTAPATVVSPAPSTVPPSATAGAGSPTAGSTATSTPATPSAGAGASSDAALVTAGGTAVLPLASGSTGGDLSSVADQPVESTGVTVQSVVTDEGFWVGTGEDDRVFVQLATGGEESDFTVEQGQVLSFSGQVTATPDGFVDDIGLTQAEGAQQLTDQGYYLSVEPSSLDLVG